MNYFLQFLLIAIFGAAMTNPAAGLSDPIGDIKAEITGYEVDYRYDQSGLSNSSYIDGGGGGNSVHAWIQGGTIPNIGASVSTAGKLAPYTGPPPVLPWIRTYEMSVQARLCPGTGSASVMYSYGFESTGVGFDTGMEIPILFSCNITGSTGGSGASYHYTGGYEGSVTVWLDMPIIANVFAVTLRQGGALVYPYLDTPWMQAYNFETIRHPDPILTGEVKTLLAEPYTGGTLCTKLFIPPGKTIWVTLAAEAWSTSSASVTANTYVYDDALAEFGSHSASIFVDPTITIDPAFLKEHPECYLKFYTFAPMVPVPSTLLLLGSGLICLAGLRKG